MVAAARVMFGGVKTGSQSGNINMSQFATSGTSGPSPTGTSPLPPFFPFLPGSVPAGTVQRSASGSRTLGSVGSASAISGLTGVTARKSRPIRKCSAMYKVQQKSQMDEPALIYASHVTAFLLNEFICESCDGVFKNILSFL